MGIKLNGFLMLFVLCAFGAGCNDKGDNKMPVDHSSFHMDKASTDRLTKNLPKVKLGFNRQQVIELLGTPYDNVGIAEPKTGLTKLKLLTYYFSIEDRTDVRETDPNLRLYFTKDDKLNAANTNTGLSIDHLKAVK
jgi:hypothetical protein